MTVQARMYYERHISKNKFLLFLIFVGYTCRDTVNGHEELLHVEGDRGAVKASEPYSLRLHGWQPKVGTPEGGVGSLQRNRSDKA